MAAAESAEWLVPLGRSAPWFRVIVVVAHAIPTHPTARVVAHSSPPCQFVRIRLPIRGSQNSRFAELRIAGEYSGRSCGANRPSDPPAIDV
jgi:hypothetical protein